MGHGIDRLAQPDQVLSLSITQRFLTGMANQALQGVPVHCTFGQTLGDENSELGRRILVHCMKHQTVCSGDWPGFQKAAE